MNKFEHDIPLMDMSKAPEDIQDSIRGFRRDLDGYILEAAEKGDHAHAALLKKAAEDIDAGKITHANFKEELKDVAVEFDDHLQSVGIEPVFEQLQGPDLNAAQDKHTSNNELF